MFVNAKLHYLGWQGLPSVCSEWEKQCIIQMLLASMITSSSNQDTLHAYHGRINLIMWPYFKFTKYNKNFSFASYLNSNLPYHLTHTLHKQNLICLVEGLLQQSMCWLWYPIHPHWRCQNCQKDYWYEWIHLEVSHTRIQTPLTPMYVGSIMHTNCIAINIFAFLPIT